MTMETDFVILVDGLSLDDDDVIGTLAEDFDAVASEHHGTMRLAVTAEGIDPLNAFSGLLVRLAQRLPDVHVLRLDPDLVNVTDIAERVGRSRQNVQQWIDGDRLAGSPPFPKPEGTAGRSRIWRWNDVHEWLHPLGLTELENLPSRDDSLVIDVFIKQWEMANVSGEPVFKNILINNDDRTEDRIQTLNKLPAVLADPELRAALTGVPRAVQQQVTVIPAVPLDPLELVMAALATDVSGIIVVETEPGRLHFLPVSMAPLMNSIPIAELGLTSNATVGDLILAHQEKLVGPATPLRLVS
jgi:hypothetical protein